MCIRDSIKGIPPASAIEQKVSSRNPRSTVGTSTEIFEYLRLLYARVRKTFSPVSGQEVKKHSAEDIVKCMLEPVSYTHLGNLYVNVLEVIDTGSLYDNRCIFCHIKVTYVI